MNMNNDNGLQGSVVLLFAFTCSLRILQIRASGYPSSTSSLLWLQLCIALCKPIFLPFFTVYSSIILNFRNQTYNVQRRFSSCLVTFDTYYRFPCNCLLRNCLSLRKQYYGSELYGRKQQASFVFCCCSAFNVTLLLCSLSSLQIVIGISSAIIYIVLISIDRKANTYYNGGYLDAVGAGIWCGGVYIIAGSLGVAAARRNRIGLMISSMVFCILSSLMIWVVIGLAAASIDTTTRDQRIPCNSRGSSYYDRYYSYYSCYIYSFSGYKTADSILIILSIVEFVIAIWCSALCCKGSCKACCRGCCYDQTQIIYMPVHFDGQRVMFIQQSGVAVGQTMSALPTQPFFVDMQQPAHVAYPAAVPPGYQPAIAGLPEYSATYTGNAAAGGATCGQPGEVTKDAMAFGQ